MKKLRIVDGYKIRNTIDIDFSCIEDSYVCPYIPANETWLDRSFVKEKKSLLATFAKKRALMKKFGYEEAKRILRRSMKKIDPSEVKIKLLGKRGPVQIWLVSGAKVREYFDFNYVFGGHDYVYKYIPKNEVWLDDAMLTKERKYVLIHELYERNLMKKGKDYDNAHDYASVAEKEARRKDKVSAYLKD